MKKAREYNEHITKAFALLECNPNMGKIVERPFRYIIINKYRFIYFYSKEKQVILITNIFHINYQHFDRPRNLSLPDLN